MRPATQDIDPEDRAALVVGHAHRHIVAVGNLTGRRDASEEKAGVRAGYEAQGERAALALDRVSAGRGLDDIDAVRATPFDRQRAAAELEPKTRAPVRTAMAGTSRA